MPEVEEKVYRLEAVLEEFIKSTGIEFNKLYNAQLRTEMELQELKKTLEQSSKAFEERLEKDRKRLEEERKAFEERLERDKKVFEERLERDRKAFEERLEKDRRRLEEERKAFEERLERDKKAFEERLERENRAFQERLEQEKKRAEEELKAWRADMNKKWGEVTNKLGTFAEDMVAPNIKGIAERYFGCEELDDFMVRRKKRHSIDRSKKREFDVIGVCGDIVIVNETKSTPKIEYINEFINALGEFYDYFPEYKGKRLIPVFASLYMDEGIVNYLSKNGIYAMAMREDTMDLLNYDEVKGNL